MMHQVGTVPTGREYAAHVPPLDASVVSNADNATLGVLDAAEPTVWPIDPMTLRTPRTLETESVVHQIVTAGR